MGEKYGAVLGIGFVCLAASCTSSSGDTGEAKDGGASASDAATSSDGGGGSVDCSHPGAGAPLGDGRCACTPAFDVSGTWSHVFDCKENGQCDKDEPDKIVLTQSGTQISGENEAHKFHFTGTLCGAYLSWSGGGSGYVDCTVVHFTDADHYTADGCYDYATDAAPSPTCAPPASGAVVCANQSGECVYSGARMPATPGPITSTICR